MKLVDRVGNSAYPGQPLNIGEQTPTQTAKLVWKKNSVGIVILMIARPLRARVCLLFLSLECSAARPTVCLHKCCVL